MQSFNEKGYSCYLRNLVNITITAATTATIIPVAIGISIFGSSIGRLGEDEVVTVGIGEGEGETIWEGVGVSVC